MHATGLQVYILPFGLYRLLPLAAAWAAVRPGIGTVGAADMVGPAEGTPCVQQSRHLLHRE